MHAGFDNNELADEYAKVGAWDSANYLVTQMTKKHVKTIIEENAWNTGQLSGKSIPTVGKQRTFIPPRVQQCIGKLENYPDPP